MTLRFLSRESHTSQNRRFPVCKVYSKAGVPQGFILSPLPFLIYVNDMPNSSHHTTNTSQFADDDSQSKNIDLAAEYLKKLARWCAKWRIKLNPEKTKVITFSRPQNAIRAQPALSLYGDILLYYPHIKFQVSLLEIGLLSQNTSKRF